MVFGEPAKLERRKLAKREASRKFQANARLRSYQLNVLIAPEIRDALDALKTSYGLSSIPAVITKLVVDATKKTGADRV